MDVISKQKVRLDKKGSLKMNEHLSYACKGNKNGR